MARGVKPHATCSSSILTRRRDGITWRGTHYSLAALRGGRRFVQV